MGMKRYGLLGYPLGHSMSPEVHDAILEQMGIHGTYTLEEVSPETFAATVPKLMRAYDGLNITIPHKCAVIPALAGLDATAQAVGAVNTIARGVGYNTDLMGFLSCGVPLHGRKVLIFGTGGTARMMGVACAQAGARQVSYQSRSKPPLSPQAQDPSHYEVLLNATPVGMWPAVQGIPCKLDGIGRETAVFDAVYNPTPTRWLLAAQAHGASTWGGLRMLVRQAVEAQRIWNPQWSGSSEELVATTVPRIQRMMYQRFGFKLVLTGFMGAGKSTLGRRLSQTLGIRFVDLDEAIEAAAGMRIADYFKRHGESAFRMLEHTVARTIFQEHSAAVIAVGGGFPCQKLNVDLLRQHATCVFYLKADFETVWQRIQGDSCRPLAQDAQKAQQLYRARQACYQDTCDACIAVDGLATVESVVASCLARLQWETEDDKETKTKSEETER